MFSPLRLFVHGPFTLIILYFAFLEIKCVYKLDTCVKCLPFNNKDNKGDMNLKKIFLILTHKKPQKNLGKTQTLYWKTKGCFEPKTY